MTNATAPLTRHLAELLTAADADLDRLDAAELAAWGTGDDLAADLTHVERRPIADRLAAHALALDELLDLGQRSDVVAAIVETCPLPLVRVAELLDVADLDDRPAATADVVACCRELLAEAA